MKLKQVILGLFLATLVLSSITAMAFSWMQVGAGALGGAVAGAIVGSLIPGIGSLIGAGVGALGGAFASIFDQLLFGAPTTSSNTTVWQNYAKNAFYQMYSESVSIADNEINIENVMKESSEVYIIAAQKYEQVNYNENISPTSPRGFYGLLVGTGFLQNAIQEIGAPQELWIEAQSQINSINSLIGPHTGWYISYNVNPNSTVSESPFYGNFLMIVQGNITIFPDQSPAPNIDILCIDGQPVNKVYSLPYTLTTGYYFVSIYGYFGLSLNPNEGAALIFQYTGSSYTPISIGFNVPSNIYLAGGGTTILSEPLPTVQVSTIYLAEEIALQMLAAAETEYTILKDLGYQNASQIPPNFQLPTLNLNAPLNFTNVSSLQEYNLLMSEYLQYLLAINRTLSLLQSEGKLQGLQNLTFSFPSPLQLYGEEGGFLFTGAIQTPYGTLPYGLYLIQPYGGPLSLSSTGGVIPQGGAVAYTLIKTPNGGYVLGNYSILPPGSSLNGIVSNPGTLYPVAQIQNISNLPSVTFSPVTTTTASLSAAISSLEQYLLSHPLVLLITIFFVLIILVAIIKALS